MNKIIDTRHRKHARKITITFCGNSIFLLLIKSNAKKYDS